MLGIATAFIGGVLTVYLLIWLQAGPPGLRRAPSIVAAVLFSAAVMSLAYAGCPNVANARKGPWRTVLATSFGHMTGPNAKWNGAGFACWRCPKGRWAPWGTKGCRYQKMTAGVVGVAHRTLRCGTLVEVQHGLQRVVVPVIDRGPYWSVPASCRPRWGYHCWLKGRAMVRLKPGWRRINDLDIMAGTARALDFPGLGLVHYRIVSRRLRHLERR